MIMRFILATMLTAALGFVAGIYLPWWNIAIVSFLVALLIVQPPGRGFLAGFTGIFILWGLLSFWIDLQNDSILSHKIALVIPLGGSSVLLILITAFLGAIVGGFAALAGSSLAPALKPGRR